MNVFFASISKSNNKPFLFIINGESNSGGYALNSEAAIGEIGVQLNVQLFNNNTLIFENLNIGVNNLLAHTGLSNGVTHGFELQIGNKADESILYERVHIIKTGQGGSTVGQWNLGGAYMNTFTSRINTAKTLIDFSEYNVVILYSLGINDAIAGTNVTTWKSNVTTKFTNLRNIINLGSTPIIMTEFQGMGGGNYSAYITAIQELASTIPDVYSVNVAGAGLRDTNHWNYAGMKQVANSLLSVAEGLV